MTTIEHVATSVTRAPAPRTIWHRITRWFETNAVEIANGLGGVAAFSGSPLIWVDIEQSASGPKEK